MMRLTRRSGSTGRSGSTASTDKSKPDAFGVRAARGSWLDQRTFAIDFNYVGLDEQHSWQLSFDGDRVTLHGKTGGGREIAVAGKCSE